MTVFFNPAIEAGLQAEVEIGCELDPIGTPLRTAVNDDNAPAHHFLEGIPGVTAGNPEIDAVSQAQRLFGVEVQTAHADVADRYRHGGCLRRQLGRSNERNAAIFSFLLHRVGSITKRTAMHNGRWRGNGGREDDAAGSGIGVGV